MIHEDKPAAYDTDGARAVRDAKKAAEAAPLALINLGWVPWGTSWKRNQSMVYQLSRSGLFDRVVFVHPGMMWIGDALKPQKGPWRHRLGRILDRFPRRYDPVVWLCGMIRFLPLKEVFPWGYKVEDRLFWTLIKVLKGQRPFVLLNNHPNFFSRGLLVDLMEEATLTVFDISDDFVEFFDEPGPRSLFQSNLEFCCSRADLVLSINEHLKDKYCGNRSNAYVIPNATNFSNFDRDTYDPVPFLERIRAKGGPILGYTGIVNRFRIDYDLLEALIRARPESQFVFLGSADKSLHSRLGEFPNVHHHPPVHYRDLPNWVAYFDAAIIPFQVNEHTRGNDLLKFNDYLAMGKSIVTTDMGGARRYADLLHIASTMEEFSAAIDEALQDVSDEVRQRRKETAKQNSWERRTLEVRSIISRHLTESQTNERPPC